MVFKDAFLTGKTLSFLTIPQNLAATAIQYGSQVVLNNKKPQKPLKIAHL